MTDRLSVRRSEAGRRSHGGPGKRAAAWLAGLALVIVACGTSISSGPTGTGSSGSGSLEPTLGPNATPWPSQVIEGAISLAAADASFKQMNTDVSTAVNAGDPQKILIVMNDALTFLKKNRVAVTYLQGYDATKETGDKIGAAYDQMIKGAQTIIDALKSGDADGVTKGFDDFFAGDAAYAEQTGALGDIATQAATMKRSYTK
jgi:hypothetical protein